MQSEVPAWVGVTYLTYIVSMVLILWGGVGVGVFVYKASGAWFLLSSLLQCCCYTPDRWRSFFVTKPTTGK